MAWRRFVCHLFLLEENNINSVLIYMTNKMSICPNTPYFPITMAIIYAILTNSINFSSI